MRIICLVFIFFSIHCSLRAQIVKIAEIQGTVIDSTLNRVIPAATVSIYNASDSSLLKYSLTDHRGIFNIKGIPQNKNLKVRFSFIGYEDQYKTFILSDTTSIKKLGKVYLKKATNLLNEVVVYGVPPVRMNGDTLEFNAAAFKLDSNAVAEDLLKKLPGVIVWGDGTITVNGKQIKNLLVNGKPFFGGENKIATQNIPKKIIDKVQIYQENLDPNNILDSISTMNIQLKKGKNSGLFGKISAGYGTSSRYDLAGNINSYNSRYQVGLISNFNNVNKNNNDIKTLIKNASYKGTGVSLETEPNLSEKGLKKSHQSGFLFSYDFLPEERKKNREQKLNLDYLYNNSNSNIGQNSIEYVSLSESEQQKNVSSIANNIMLSKHDFKGAFLKKNQQYQFRFDARTDIDRQRVDLDQRDSVYRDNNISSFRTLRSLEDISLDKLSIGFSIDKNQNLDNNSKITNVWSLAYSGGISTESTSQDYSSLFKSLIDTLSNVGFNREDTRKNKMFNHKLDLKYGDFASLFFNKLSNTSLFLKGVIDVSKSSTDNLIYDDYKKQYGFNGNLSYIADYNIGKYTPSLVFNKTIRRILSNRYQRFLNLNFDIGNIFVYQKNSSSQEFQNFSRSYSKFLPKLSIDYDNYEYGKYQYKLDFNLKTIYNFPEPMDMVPILDSSRVYNIKVSNPNLLPMRTNQFSIGFNYSKLNTKNLFRFNINTVYEIADNYISNHTYYDPSGKSFFSLINVEGYKNFVVNLDAEKSIKMKNSILQLSLRSNTSFAHVPSVIKSDSSVNNIISSNTISTNRFTVLYNMSNRLALSLDQELFWYRTAQKQDVTKKFSTANHITKFTLALNALKGLTIRPNVSLFYNDFQSYKERYSLLNADVSYRALGNKNLEMKLSIYDILGENKQITNYIGVNSFKQTQFNALSRYFMLSMSYYLRKF